MHVAVNHANANTLFIAATESAALAAANKLEAEGAFSEEIYAQDAYVIIINNDEELICYISNNALEDCLLELYSSEWHYAYCTSCDCELYNTETYTCEECNTTHSRENIVQQAKQFVLDSFVDCDSSRGLTVVNLQTQAKVLGACDVVFV